MVSPRKIMEEISSQFKLQLNQPFSFKEIDILKDSFEPNLKYYFSKGQQYSFSLLLYPLKPHKIRVFTPVDYSGKLSYNI